LENSQTIQAGFGLWSWYIFSIKSLFSNIKLIVLKTLDYFSVTILLKTLFYPWRRDVMTTRNLPINIRFRVMIFNLLSRLIGACVRLVTIFIGLIITFLVYILGAATIVVWILMPMLVLAGFIIGISKILTG